ncbi:MAG: TIR domain-containing protein [Vicinamibacterales bacterium]
MASYGSRRHVFISHHHADDQSVTDMTDLLAKGGHAIRNSSVRMKPANQDRMDRGLIKDETIRRILRMKISWAGTVVVLIGANTHTRPWVNWEIEEANRQGKRIVGVFIRGGTNADVPSALERHASAMVGWNTDRIVDAIDGSENDFQNSDGSPRAHAHARTSFKC